MVSLSNSEKMNSGNDDVPKNDEINEKINHKENIEPCSKDKEIVEASESDDIENVLASHIKVSKSKVLKIDDKENASASDENRYVIHDMFFYTFVYYWLNYLHFSLNLRNN